ncbi:MAG: alcohol dehydrogenase catalytic domain-containing protein [Candidatus Brocadiia bacterium]
MSNKMIAVMKTKPEVGAELREIPIPEPGPKDLLVKVRATSICGTDVHIYKWEGVFTKRIKPPMVFGHEFCGDVVKVGRDVTGFKEGDYVSAESHIPCTVCPVCRNNQMHICHNLKILGVDTVGCFSNFCLVPEICAWKNDPSLPTELACIQEPVGNAVYTVLAEPITGKSVVVIGDGPAGCNMVGVARASGAGRIWQVGKYPFRLNIGKQMGADVSINIKEPGTEVVKRIVAETAGIGVDVVLDTVGNQEAVNWALGCVRKGGRISAFGIPSAPITIDYASGIVFKGARLLGINGRLMYDTWFQMAGLLASKKFDPTPIITHRIKLSEFEKGFAAMTSDNRTAGKVVMYPD